MNCNTTHYRANSSSVPGDPTLSTLGLGGLIFGSINVVSMGFAAILLGLAVDYAVVHYQEALAHPTLSIPQIRGAIAPSIFWAAVTTISAFLVLNFGGLPGLAQLGTLVGVGVALSACIMIFEFLPPLFPGRTQDAQPEATATDSPAPPRVSRLKVVFVSTTTIVLALFAATNLAGPPGMDPTANALRPRHSQAYETLDQLKNKLNEKREPLWVIVPGTDRAIAQKLDELEPVLARAVSNNVIGSFTLPTPLWPRSQYQTQNRQLTLRIAQQRDTLRASALAHGFTENALGLSDRILATWNNAASLDETYWPTNQLSQWILEKVVARTTTNYLALGFLNPVTNAMAMNSSGMAVLQEELRAKGLLLSGWELLGQAIFSRVRANMWKVLIPMCCLVFFSLLLSFRRPREVLLSLAVLALSAGCLLGVMKLAGWSWNLLNLMALPLVLGTGVDYSIFMQLALRRHHGDLKMAYQAVGRALLLCGGTAIAGFGSLAWSSNAGMASLGQVCATGIAGNMLISVYLLPAWWALSARRNPDLANAEPSSPSSLYRAELWRMGCLLVRLLPVRLCLCLSRFAVGLYWHVAIHRRNVVIENLLPALNNNRAAAKRTARNLFQQFGIKVIDLWRYEAGLPIDDLLGEYTGWEYFLEVKAQKRGVLILTPHLGNWEFGGPWLTRKGFPLQVITMAEPGKDFTNLRQASRARWNIETLVIGNDPFAFVEVIRRLEEGATVALLVDRPPPPTAVEVELFGRTFSASVAAAELARASGCVLLPVYLPRQEHSYAARVLAPIEYDRASLRDRAARQQLTQKIIRAFEPAIRQHLDQWYHFVPVWPEGTGEHTGNANDSSSPHPPPPRW